MRFASTQTASPPVPSCDNLLDVLRKRIDAQTYLGEGSSSSSSSSSSFARSSIIRDVQNEQAKRGLGAAPAAPSFSLDQHSLRAERARKVADALYGTSDYGQAGIEVVIERDVEYDNEGSEEKERKE
jgi:hypothetical protein